jgi:hypothetical protein
MFPATGSSVKRSRIALVELIAPRVLIAAAPSAARRLQAVLAGHGSTLVRTVEEAREALAAERFALAILGVYFDESRMFDVMSYARTGGRNRDVPIVCVRGMPGSMSPVTLRMLEQTINALSGCEYLDLVGIPDDEAGNALVLRRLARHLGPILPPPTPATPALRPTP